MNGHQVRLIEGDLGQFAQFPSEFEPLKVLVPHGKWIYQQLSNPWDGAVIFAFDSQEGHRLLVAFGTIPHMVIPQVGPPPDELTLKSEPTAHTTRPDVTKWPGMSRSSRSGGGSRSR